MSGAVCAQCTAICEQCAWNSFLHGNARKGGEVSRETDLGEMTAGWMRENQRNTGNGEGI